MGRKNIVTKSLEYAESIIDTVREPLVVLDQDLRVISVSRSFYDIFKVTPEDTLGQLIYDIGNKQWDIPKLRELLETILPRKSSFDNYEVEQDFAAIGRRIMLLNARQIKRGLGKDPIILLAIEDITERKRSQELLNESEERFRRLFETANDGILLLEKNELKIQNANPAITSMLGYPNTECIGKDMKDIGFPQDMGTIQELMQTLDEDGIKYYKDAPVKMKTGQVVHTDIYFVDKTKLIQCNIRDITERKRMEQALLASEERYRLLTQNSLTGIYIHVGGLLEFVNRRFTEMLGYALEELIGRQYWDFVHPEDREMVRNISLARARGDKAPYEYEFRHLKKDGKTLWVHNLSTVIQYQGLTASMGNLAQIDDRKQAEKALSESEALFRRMFNQAPIGAAMVSLDYRYLMVNEALCRITGYSAEELTSRSVADISHPDDIEADVAQAQRLATGEIDRYGIEKRYLHADGSVVWVRNNVRLIRDEQGQALYFLPMMENINDRKRAEQAKVELEAQFQQAQKMESVGRLAGGVAHDYNNMLSVIIGYAELAIDKMAPSDPLHGDLQEIYAAARRAKEITRQLLAFARQQTIAPAVLDLNTTVEGMLKMLRRLIGENINLAWLPYSDLWPIKMDPSQLDQIFANLCVNARDAITDVGKLSVETQNVTFDEAYCTNHLGFIPGDFVMLAVSDDGCGMDREKQAHIFEPFFTTKAVGKGTGLGLATVYGIVKQNDGFINVYSEPGQGTTFRIYLPRYKGMLTDAMEEKATPIPEGKGEWVLVVEDDAAVMKLTAKILNGLNYTVLTAQTRGKAMDLAERHAHRIELLLIDVVMPEMNGRDLANEIRSICPNLKTLFMSGYTADVIAQHGVLEEGVNLIQKPFATAAMASAVRKALEEEVVSAR